MASRRAPGAASPAAPPAPRAVLEHTEDRLPIGNVERDDPGFAVVRVFKAFGGLDELGLAKAGGEVEDGSVGYRDPCKPHSPSG